MRIGIISDLHSNPDALQAVFNEFDKRGVEKMLLLGDIIGIGHRPEDCAQLLMTRKDKLLGAVRGNHEGYYLIELPKYSHSTGTHEPIHPEVLRYFKWNHAQLSESSTEFLKTLAKEQTVETDGATIYLTHYPFGEDGKYLRYIAKPNAAECAELFAGHDADVYLFGHTHYLEEIHEGGKHYINPGCVGCPIETNSASAGILDINNGEISYERIDAAYDIEKVIRETEALIPEYPAAAHMLHEFYRK